MPDLFFIRAASLRRASRIRVRLPASPNLLFLRSPPPVLFTNRFSSQLSYFLECLFVFMWHVGFVNLLLWLGCSCHFIFTYISMRLKISFTKPVTKTTRCVNADCAHLFRILRVLHRVNSKDCIWQSSPDIDSHLARLDLTVTCAGVLHLRPTLLA